MVQCVYIVMPLQRFSANEAYGPERLLAVSYPMEVRALLRPQLREQRRLAEARAKRLVWADERATMARSLAMGRMSVRRPDGEERGTRGIVVRKDEGDGTGMIVGWVEVEYRSTKTITRTNRFDQRSRTKVHGGTKFASVTIGRAHETPTSKGDVCVAVPGHGLMYVTPEETVSTGDNDVKAAFEGTGLTDEAYAGARRKLDRIDGALALIGQSMRDPGLNPEIALYLGSGVGSAAQSASDAEAA